MKTTENIIENYIWNEKTIGMLCAFLKISLGSLRAAMSFRLTISDNCVHFSHTLCVSTIRIIIIKEDINYFSNEAPTTFGNKEDYPDEEIWNPRNCCSFSYV